MTAIANVGIAEPLFSVTTLLAGPTSTAGYVPSGIYCLGALTAPDGQFLYLSSILFLPLCLHSVHFLHGWYLKTGRLPYHPLYNITCIVYELHLHRALQPGLLLTFRSYDRCCRELYLV